MSNHNDIHKKNKTSFQKQYLSRRNPFIDYLIRATEGTLKIFLLAIFAMAVSLGFLYLFRLFWFGYLSVPVGQKFLALFSNESQIINEILNRNIAVFSFEISFNAFIICLIVGAVCRLVHITRRFYDPMHVIGKALIWGTLMTVLVAGRLHSLYGFEQWRFSVFSAFIPTYCLYAGCLAYTSVLLPELGDIFRMIISVKNFFFSGKQRN